MERDQIDQIYQVAEIVFNLNRIVDHIHRYMEKEAADLLPGVFAELTELCKKCITEDLDEGKKLWEVVKELSVHENLVRLGDIIEADLLPLVKRYIKNRCNIEQKVSAQYALRSSESGYLSLYSTEYDRYIHSMVDPMFEAYQYVKEFYDCSKRLYYVYGSGLGYEAFCLYIISEGFTNIVLYEPEDQVYELAKQVGVLMRIPGEKITRKRFDSAQQFLEEAESKKAGILIYAPIAKITRDDEDRKILRTFLMKQDTDRRLELVWSCNRIRNENLNLPDAQQYVESTPCDEAIVVAAGPSLTELTEFLSNNKGKRIISVGHAFRYLVERQIIPDCVTIIDPSRYMSDHIKGLEKSESTLLIDEYVYWKVADQYEGPVYLMRNWTYEGTVSAAAIEVALRMGAKKIYLVGLDLGYPTFRSHAVGIEESKEVDAGELFPVDSVEGGKVMTDLHLNYYRERIEQQIQKHKDVQFYNLSEHGAKITGTIKLSVDQYKAAYH